MNNDIADIALLPNGLRDGLPPEAAFEAAATERLLAAFAGRGYERIKPPLLEFEESLFAGSARATAPHAFRLMDPVTRRMMAIRPDITVQVARIATTRLIGAARPLRLGYAGQILRTKGSQLRPERQFTQVGAELIGAPSPAGDVEVMAMAAEALLNIGVGGLSVDLGLPALVPAVLDGVDDETATLARAALDRKDAAAVAGLSGRLGQKTSDLLSRLLSVTGPAEAALRSLDAIELTEPAASLRSALADCVAGLRAELPGLLLTLDAVENRGFEYHTGVTFTLFASGVSGELGRGGRYEAGSQTQNPEPATGVTLFMDTVLQALPKPDRGRRIFLPFGTTSSSAAGLRDQGWITIAGLDPVVDIRQEAGRMDCGHLLAEGEIIEIQPKEGD